MIRYLRLVIIAFSVLAAPGVILSVSADVLTPATMAEASCFNSPVCATWRQLVPGKDGDTEISTRSVLLVSSASRDPCALKPGAKLRGRIPFAVGDTANKTPPDNQGDAAAAKEVAVCEQRSALNAEAGPTEAALVRVGPARIVVIGDTGCREENGQHCDDQLNGEPWPFAEVAATAASQLGEDGLIIHVGDYRYRGQDDWQSWWKDFFAPADKLVGKAPWVMVRGNHDNCHGNKGQGWLALFGPWPVTSDHKNDCRQAPIHQDPYAIDLGDKLRLIVTDTANAKHRCESWTEAFAGGQRQAIKDLIEDALRSDRRVWLLSHFPVLGIEEDELAPCARNDTAGHILRTGFADVLEERNVDAILSGDIHQFQILGRGDARGPIQFVVGNGGAQRTPGFGSGRRTSTAGVVGQGWRVRKQKVDAGDAACLDDNRQLKDGIAYLAWQNLEFRMPAQREIWPLKGWGSCAFGYLLAMQQGKGWAFTAKQLGVAETAQSCSLPGGRQDCLRAPDGARQIRPARTAAAAYERSLSWLVGRNVYAVRGLGAQKLGTIAAVLPGLAGDRHAYAIVALNGPWLYGGRTTYMKKEIVVPLDEFAVADEGLVLDGAAEVTSWVGSDDEAVLDLVLERNWQAIEPAPSDGAVAGKAVDDQALPPAAGN